MASKNHVKKFYEFRNVILLLFLVILAQKCAGQNCTCSELKVMSLNVWGLPKFLVEHARGETREDNFLQQRFEGIGQLVALGDYDIFLIQELWMRKQHDFINSKVPPGFSMTTFRDFNFFKCFGRITPLACSGLAIISRFPLIEVEFNRFHHRGNWRTVLTDGEILAVKGLGRVRIEPQKDVFVDAIVSHMAADPDKSHGFTNAFYRKKQTEQLVKMVKDSDAQVVIAGGDFNFSPDKKEGKNFVKSNANFQKTENRNFYVNLKFTHFSE